MIVWHRYRPIELVFGSFIVARPYGLGKTATPFNFCRASALWEGGGTVTG